MKKVIIALVLAVVLTLAMAAAVAAHQPGWAGAGPPTEEELCDHLSAMGVTPPPCEE